MHKKSSTGPFPPQSSPSPPSDGSCPVKAPNTPLPSSTPKTSTFSVLNPLNYMPSNLSQSRASNQTVHLPTERELSSIPRGDTDSNWEYPSPQQMYNAMLRKGYDDTPEDAVESMVAVHNFLNEGAWAEIVAWEQRFSQGLGKGWQACSRGESGFMESPMSREMVPQPKLLRFMGRPGDVSPKARILEFMGWLRPSKFGYVARLETVNLRFADSFLEENFPSTDMTGLCRDKRLEDRFKRSDTLSITTQDLRNLQASRCSTSMFGLQLMDLQQPWNE